MLVYFECKAFWCSPFTSLISQGLLIVEKIYTLASAVVAEHWGEGNDDPSGMSLGHKPSYY